MRGCGRGVTRGWRDIWDGVTETIPVIIATSCITKVKVVLSIPSTLSRRSCGPREEVRRKLLRDTCPTLNTSILIRVVSPVNMEPGTADTAACVHSSWCALNRILLSPIVEAELATL